MKKRLNVIQINGIRGLIMAAGIVSCLAAGFIVFPGWVSMNIWNYAANYANLPTIGLLQGILLWGILYLTYMLLRKERVIVCLKSPRGLSEEELKTVFADMKKQAQEDPILQAMIKAREAEMKYSAQQEIKSNESENATSKEDTKV